MPSCEIDVISWHPEEKRKYILYICKPEQHEVQNTWCIFFFVSRSTCKYPNFVLMKNWKLLIFQKNLGQLLSCLPFAREKGRWVGKTLKATQNTSWNLRWLIPHRLEMLSRARQTTKTLPLLWKREFLGNFF